MALTASVEFEVDAATGNDANGGGFDTSQASPGTDYSYGAGQTVISWAASGGTHTNDLASTSASSWLVLTSSARNFIAADVGNIINIQSGTNFTPGRYCIVSVAANAATLDRACGATGDASAGAGRLGGAFLTIGGAGLAHAVGGQHIWIKYNASAYVAANTNSNVASGRLTLTAGSPSAPTLLRGYQTTRGDETSNIPTYAWGVNASNNYLITAAANCTCVNLVLDGQRGAGWTATRGLSGGTSVLLRRIKFTSFVSQALASGIEIVTDCEFTDCSTGTTALFAGGSTGGMFVGCYIHDNTVTNQVFTVTTGTMQFTDCIFDTTTTGSVFASTGAAKIRFINCTIYSTGSYGMDLQAAPDYAEFINCHFQACGNVAVNTGGIYPTVRMLYCSFYNNTGGNYSTTNILARNRVGEVSITDGDPLVDAAGGDFRPNKTALRGALLRGAGFPQTYMGSAVANRPDIGAMQHADPAIVTPAAGKIYAGQQVTSDGTALVTGTLHASNMFSVGGVGSNDLSAATLASGQVVDDVTGSLSAAAGGGGSVIGSGIIVPGVAP